MSTPKAYLLPKKYSWYPNAQIESPSRIESFSPAPKKISYFQRRGSAATTTMMQAVQGSAIKPQIGLASMTTMNNHKYKTSAVLPQTQAIGGVTSFSHSNRRMTKVA
jgi:hypothetical protein